MSNEDCDAGIKLHSSQGSSSEESLDEIISTTTTSTLHKNADWISICSLESNEHIPEEIRKGAAYSLDTICIDPGSLLTDKEILPKIFSASDWEQKLLEMRQKIFDNKSMADIHLRFSDIFKNRLRDIETKASHDLETKEQMYKDWVSILVEFNKNVFEELRSLENAISELQYATRAYSLLSSSRRDLSTLIQLIEDAFHQRKWSLTGIKLETLDMADVMGLNKSNPHHAGILCELIRSDTHI